MRRVSENHLGENAAGAGVPTMRRFGILLLALCFVLTVVIAVMHAPVFGTAIVVLAVIAGALITSGS